MRASTIGRNYAEALFELGERSGHTERYAELIDAVGGAMEADRQVRLAMVSPRVPKDTKAALLRRALQDTAPDEFIRFLEAVIRRSRQVLLPVIAEQYQALVDVKFNRVHAGVTLARAPDDAMRAEVARRLSEVFGKEVIPHFREDPAILGGLVVRMGDRVMDGSLRRKMVRLKQHLLG